MQVACSEKRNVMVWHQSICPFVHLSDPSAYSPRPIKGSIRCFQRTFRPNGGPTCGVTKISFCRL